MCGVLDILSEKEEEKGSVPNYTELVKEGISPNITRVSISIAEQQLNQVYM